MFKPLKRTVERQNELLRQLEEANERIRLHNIELEEKVEEKTKSLRESVEIQSAINSLLNLSVESMSLEDLNEHIINNFIKPSCAQDISGIVLLTFDKESPVGCKLDYYGLGDCSIEFNKISNSSDPVSTFEENFTKCNLNYKLYSTNIEQRFYSFLYLISKNNTFPKKLDEFANIYITLISNLLQRLSLRENIKEEKEKITNILNNVLTGVITINNKGIIQSFNKYAEKLFGYEQEEVIGKNLTILMPEPHKSNHDDYIKHYFDAGVAKIVGHELRELEAVKKNGQKFPIELSVNKFNFSGETYFVGSIVDITQKKEAEYELHLRKAGIDAAANSIVITDKDGIILYINSAFTKLTGFTKEDTFGKKTNILKSGKHTQSFYEELWNTILSGEIWTGRMINKKKNGELYTEEMTITPVKNKEGEIINFIAVKQDKTLEVEREKRIANYTKLLERQKDELEKLAEELKESNLQKDKFFSIIAHDLKSPFSALLGYTQILLEEFDELSNEEIKTFTESISRVTRNIYQLILDLLDWARLQTGRMEIMQTDFNLYILVAETINLLKPVAEEKRIKLIYSGEKDLSVFADENMIKTVIRNLISNAIKFTNQGGEVKASIQKNEDKIEVCIEDNGVGMTEEEVSKLFRLDTHHTTQGTANEKGTGLGLLLCKEMIEKNDGEIWVESSKGKGSKFYFNLPVHGKK